MNKKIVSICMGALLAFSLSGCGSTQSNQASPNKKDIQSSNASKSKNDSSMKDMNMTSQQPLTKAFQDEIMGFSTIEQDVKKGDFNAASTVADQLHNEYHAAILPPLKEKKGGTYAENMHGKYDELQDAIKSKNNANIASLLKVNRDNLNIAAKILGVSLK